MTDLTPNERVRAIRLYKAGNSVNAIAVQLGKPRQISAIWKYLWRKGIIQEKIGGNDNE